MGAKYLRLPMTLRPSARSISVVVGSRNRLFWGTRVHCCIINAFNVLYVSPTNQQTKTFSTGPVEEPIETSDALKAWTTSKLVTASFKSSSTEARLLFATPTTTQTVSWYSCGPDSD